MPAEAFIHPEDCDEEAPRLTAESFNISHGKDGRSFRVFCGSGIPLKNPLYSLFCEHVVDASVLDPLAKAFTCPHKGCAELVPRCDTRAMSLKEVNATIRKLRSEAKGGGAKGNGGKVPSSPCTRPRKAAAARSKDNTTNPSSRVTRRMARAAVTLSSPPPMITSSRPQSLALISSSSPVLARKRTRNTPANAVVIFLDSSDEDDTPALPKRQRAGGRLTTNDP